MTYELNGQVFEQHDLLRVPQSEIEHYVIAYKTATIAGKSVSELGNEGELRWCDNCGRWELLFWATEHVSFDVPVEAFSHLELVTR